MYEVDMMSGKTDVNTCSSPSITPYMHIRIRYIYMCVYISYKLHSIVQCIILL